MIDFISRVGASVIHFIRAFGRSAFMLWGALVGKPNFRKHSPLLIKQLYSIGVQSLLIIMLIILKIKKILFLK